MTSGDGWREGTKFSVATGKTTATHPRPGPHPQPGYPLALACQPLGREMKAPRSALLLRLGRRSGGDWALDVHDVQ